MTKQTSFERLFLINRNREVKALTKAVPNMLMTLVDFIQGLEIAHPNWEQKSLPQLRKLFMEVKNEDDGEKAFDKLNDMILILNGWHTLTKKRLSVRKTQAPNYYGKLAYFNRFEIEILG